MGAGGRDQGRCSCPGGRRYWKSLQDAMKKTFIASKAIDRFESVEKGKEGGDMKSVVLR